MGDAAGVMDPQAAVDQLFGEGKAQVVEAVTSTRVTETEVILINGAPVQLVGEDGESLKAALMAGRLPDQQLLSRVLSSVLGNELKGITKFESEVNVTSKMTSKDTLSVIKGGRVVNERTREWRSDSQSEGKCSETFTPSPFFSPSSSTASSRTTPSPSSLQSQTSSSNLSRSSSGRSTSFPRGQSKDSALGKSSSGTSSPLARDFSLNLRSHFSTPDGSIRREPCMSPELEESLARTSIKDPNGLRKKDFEHIANHIVAKIEL